MDLHLSRTLSGVTIKDNKNLKLYFRSYDCSSLFLVDLNKVDFLMEVSMSR